MNIAVTFFTLLRSTLCTNSSALVSFSSMPRSEAELVASCKSGHLQDFDPLYRSYVERIYAFSYRRAPSREVAEDITSATFLRALEKIGSFDPARGVFSAWLYGIAKNALTDYYRSLKTTVPIEDAWDLPSDSDATEDTGKRLNREQLKKALSTLDSRKREILLLRFWDDLSYKEIAELTGESEGNCKMIVSRSVQSLRGMLPLAALLLLLFPPRL